MATDTKSSRPWLSGLVASLVVVPASTLIAYGFLYYRHSAHRSEMRDLNMPPDMLADMRMFGAGDLMPFAFWSLGLAILLLFVVAVASRLTFRLPVAARVVAWCIIGPLVGFGWTLLVASALGPWIGAFSFPVLYCWIGGTVLAIITAQAVPAVHRGA